MCLYSAWMWSFTDLKLTREITVIVQQSGYGHGCPKFWGHGLLPFEELVVMVMITHSHDDHDHDDGDNDYVYTWNRAETWLFWGRIDTRYPKMSPDKEHVQVVSVFWLLMRSNNIKTSLVLCQSFWNQSIPNHRWIPKQVSDTAL